MQQIGRRLFYDTTSGNVIKDTGEKSGEVFVTDPNNDFTVYPELSGRTAANTGWIDYTFGDAQFLNGAYGSLHVDPASKALTVYPHFTDGVDHTSIPADGTTTATVTVNLPSGYTANTDPISFSVNGGAANNVTPINGAAAFGFKTAVAGSYTISISSAKFGSGQLTISAT